jgi:hypothetical protein
MNQAPDAAAHQLDSVAALAEQRFLAAGENLEEAVGILDRLAQCFAGYIAELAGTALDRMYRDLAAAAGHVASLAETHNANARALDELDEIVAAARHRVLALEPITREVEMLSLSARVVAGGMGEAAADFAAFAGAIRGAAQRARSSLSEACDALTGADRELTAARAEASAFACRHGDVMAAIPVRLAGNLRSLTAQQQLASDAAAVAQRQSEEVRHHVAEQIAALQLGDITRQRVEHVQAAMQLSKTPQRQVGALLSAQLSDTADQLSREGERIEAGLRQLAQAARAIGGLGNQVHGESSAGGFIAALEADVRQTAVLFDELSAGDAKTDKCMARVLEAAAALMSRLAMVQSVQEDIRIMGLNATLKCGRLGNLGRPLAAVAQELRLCSGRFGAHASSVLQDVDRLRSIATGLCDPSRRNKHAEVRQAADNLLVPLRQLSELQRTLSMTLSELESDADRVGRLVETAVSQFATRHALASTIRAASAEFSSWTNDSACADVLDRIATIYTMAREREVHARFAPLPQEAVSTELSDVLF